MQRMGDGFRKGLEIRKQTKNYNQVGYRNSKDHSEVVVSLPFWEFKRLKISSWQQGVGCGLEGRQSCFPFLSTSLDMLGDTRCFHHCQVPLSPSAPRGWQCCSGSSCDCRGLDGTCFSLLCTGPFKQYMGR